jgi:pyruvate/2-oxoglutarate dehydrogenase complex dihydrolipoamide dehydrogenase (E3) component
LRVGCIPSKALLESSEIYWAAKNALGAHGVAVQGVELDLATLLGRKDKIVRGLTGGVRQLLKKNKVEHIRGNAQLADQRTVKVESDDGPLTLRARHLVLATGSLPASLSGVEPDGELVVTSTEALSFEKVPEHLVVVGAGYIGLELGSVWRRLGAQVTVLEYLDRILPGMDKEIADEALKIFGKQGLEFRLGSKVTGAKSAKNRATVECEGEDPIECDRVLVAVGRRPNTNGLGLESLDVEIDSGGRVVVDEQFQTTVPGIYAIGDLIAGPMLAHKAMEEGVACADLIAGDYGRVNYDAIPGVVFTHPENRIGRQNRGGAEGGERGLSQREVSVRGQRAGAEPGADGRLGQDPCGRKDGPNPGRPHYRSAGGRIDRRGNACHGVRGEQRGRCAHDPRTPDAGGDAEGRRTYGPWQGTSSLRGSPQTESRRRVQRSTTSARISGLTGLAR